MSRYAIRIQHASVSAEEAVSARSWFTEYSVAIQSVIVNKNAVGKDEARIDQERIKARELYWTNKENAKKRTQAKKEEEEKKKTEEAQTVRERQHAYDMIAEEREMILQALDGAGCECPGCGQVIMRNGGDNNVMCGCEAEAAGGTMAKALQGGGCGCCFDTQTLKVVNPKHGQPGAPANGRQWKFHR